MSLKDWWTSLSSGEKLFVGALGVFAGGAAVKALAGNDEPEPDDAPFGTPGWLREENRQDRSLRRRYRSGNVLRQPTIEARDGRRLRPDNIVLTRRGPHVVERKDVGELRPAHVFQAADYAEEVGGTAEVRVSCDTAVPERTALIAEMLRVGIKRSRC